MKLAFITSIVIFFTNHVLLAQQSYVNDHVMPKPFYYQNPIIPKYLADPFITYDKGYYYFFSSGKAEDGRYIPIYKSKNLNKWEFVKGAVANGKETDWNYKHFWAPEVMKIKGKYYLYYTASPEQSPSNSGNRVGVAVADKIDGPYENIGVVIPNGSLDGHPYKDKDGTFYIYYTIEWQNSKGFKAGEIYMDKMLSPTTVADKPIKLISHHNWQEGPFMQRKNKKYFLTYSCGAWSDSTYHVRYALGNSAMGPFLEQKDSLLKSNDFVKGPGHHSLFKDKKGKYWIVYHGWDNNFTARYPRLDRVKFKGNKIITDGPTFTIQAVNKKLK